MKNLSKKDIEENMIKLYSKISQSNLNEKRKIESISYYKDFKFNETKLGINNAYVVKSRETEDQLEKEIYEIYDNDNMLVSTIDENGRVEFSQEYLEQLEEINEGYFDMLMLDEQEFMDSKELYDNDIILTRDDLEERQTDKRLEKISKVIGSKDIKSYSEINIDQKPKFDKITNKQEIDPYTKVTGTETLADMIPEIKKKNIVKLGVVYSDYSKGQSGRFSFVGIDDKGKIQEINSLENTQGTTTGQTVTSINSRDGSLVVEEQVSGLARINGRSKANGEEEMLSIRTGQYGILEVDYVRADLSKDKEERYLSAPIETKNMRPSTRQVRDFMDKSKNTEIASELERAENEIDRDEETEIRNIDDTASNDNLNPDDVITLESGKTTTLIKEAKKAKISPEEFARRYNNMGGKTPDEKIENIQDDIVEEFGSPSIKR